MATLRKAKVRRAASVSPPWSIRSPSLRAASTNVTSFSRVKACKGVLVRFVRTVQFSRSAASSTAIVGGASVRFQ